MTGNFEQFKDADYARITAGVVEAVCQELGIGEAETDRRLDVERRIATAYGAGRRQPLNLVTAGLGIF